MSLRAGVRYMSHPLISPTVLTPPGQITLMHAASPVPEGDALFLAHPQHYLPPADELAMGHMHYLTLPRPSDDFDDNEIDTEYWDEVEVAGGQVLEQNERLECTCNFGGRIAGLVSKTKYDLSDHSIEVEVLNDGTSYQALFIGLTKHTNVDPDTASSNYYRIFKFNTANDYYVQRKLSGVKTTRKSGTWTGPLGSLKIEIVGNQIRFYEEDILRHAETYALASKEVYMYLYCFGGGVGYRGMDYFDYFFYT